MKKLIIIVCISIIYMSAAVAQISNDRGTFIKPAKGDWSVETMITTNSKGGTAFTFNDQILQIFFDGINKDL